MSIGVVVSVVRTKVITPFCGRLAQGFCLCSGFRPGRPFVFLRASAVAMEGEWDDGVLEQGIKQSRRLPITSSATKPKPVVETPAKRRRVEAVSTRKTAKKSSESKWQKHLVDCSLSTAKCDRCKFAVNCEAWKAATPLCDANPGAGSWLLPGPPDDPDWSLLCAPCVEMAKTATAKQLPSPPQFSLCGSSLHLGNLKQHALTKRHKDACAAALSAPVCSGAPDTAVFQNAWTGAVTGSTATHLGDGRKRATLEWCIYEAIRDVDRTFLAKASAIAVLLDERNGRILLKFHACDDELNVRVGVIALLQDHGKAACDVANAVHDALKKLATRRRLHPQLNKPFKSTPAASHGVLDRDLLAHVTQSVVCYAADGASAEQLAGQMLHPNSVRNSLAAKLPNLRLLIRDKAHSSRHLVRHGFQADPVLEKILNTVIMQKSSITNTLKNSLILRRVFKQEVADQAVLNDMLTCVSDLSFAKQRFDSIQKPLGRIVLNLEALIATATIVLDERGPNSNEGSGAADFLNLLSDEVVVLLGMMADASDECMIVTRMFDHELFDVAAMPRMLDNFHSRVQSLFQHRHCLTTGYTKTALDFLSRLRILHAPGVPSKSLGARSVEDMAPTTDKCLARMTNWAFLTKEIAKTEFPTYDLLAALDVFGLYKSTTTEAAARPLTATPSNVTLVPRLRRVAEIMDISPDDLVTQMEEHKRLAQHAFDQNPAAGAVAAWADALARTQRTARLREKFPSNALKQALQFYAVAPGSTSGIEQNFSQLKRAMNEQWHGSPDAEERRMVLIVAGACGKAAVGDSPTVSAAATVWATTFGAPRLSGERRTKGLGYRLSRQRARTAHAKSHAAWLRSRRAKVHEAVLKGCAAPPASLETVEAYARDQWTEQHAKEVQRQQAVRTKRHLDAVVCGTAAASSLGPDADLELHKREDEKRQKETARQTERTATIHAPSAVPPLEGKTTWIDPAVAADVEEESVQRALREHRIVHDRTLADVIVVKDPSNPGTRNRTVAALRGSTLVDPAFLSSKTRGVALTFRSMLLVRRKVFLSSAVCEAHVGVADILRAVTQTVPSGRKNRWLLFVGDTQHKLFLEKARASVAKRAAEVATVLLKTELRNPQFAQSPRRCTLPDFVDALGRVLAPLSRTGIGRR